MAIRAVPSACRQWEHADRRTEPRQPGKDQMSATELSLFDSQEEVYAALFYGSLILFPLAEFLIPRLRARYGIGARWVTNFALAGINILAARLVLPAIALALYMDEKGWGLLHWSGLPLWVSLPAGILILDFALYWLHRATHAVPFLWRLHVAHHADLDIDFTTGFRHHPFEVLFSAGMQLAVVALFGISPLAVLAFGMLDTIWSIYTHTNIRIPPALDRLLRTVFVTRDAHIVHHSATRAETDSNFSEVFLFWDRLFGTYCPQPAKGQEQMTIGLEYFREPRDLVIDRVLTMPFRVPRSAQSPARPDGTRTARPPA